MPSVICVGGVDPSGGAGLSADMRALERIGTQVFPVVSAITVQSSKEFLGLSATEPRLLRDMLDCVLDETGPGVLKLGMAGSAENAVVAAEFASEHDMELVVDPVLVTSSGHSLAEEPLLDAYRTKVFPEASLVTPNAPEAALITGIDVKDLASARDACRRLMNFGPRAVLITGGHLEEQGVDLLYDGEVFVNISGETWKRDVRGTGCTYSSLIAGALALGFELGEAVRISKLWLRQVLGIGSALRSPSSDMDEISAEVLIARARLCGLLPTDWMPEVGTNIAYAAKGARSQEDVCTLDSRLVRKGDTVVTFGVPVFGRDSHVARVVLAAMSCYSDCRCAVNLRFDEDRLSMVSRYLKVVGFDRAMEPEGSSTMEWGTLSGIQQIGELPDLIFDKGGTGKEPMLRVLGSNPSDVLNKIKLVIEGAK